MIKFITFIVVSAGCMASLKWAWAVVLGSILILQIPSISANPDDDNNAELRIDGPQIVRDGNVLSESVQIDDDIPATGEGNTVVGEDLVGAVVFTLVIPEICKDDPADNDHVDGKMRGISVSIDDAWTIKFFDVKKIGPNHEIKVVASTLAQNLDTSNGRKVADIACTVDVTGAKTVTQSFKDIFVRKFDPDNLSHLIDVPVSGEPRQKLALGRGVSKADINADGFIDGGDVGLMVDILTGSIVPTETQAFAADLFPAKTGITTTCGDGVIDFFDLAVLVDIVEGRVSILDQCGFS